MPSQIAQGFASGNGLDISMNGISLLQSNLIQIDEESYYRTKTYVPSTFVPIKYMIVFDDTLKRQNTIQNKKERKERMTMTNRLLSPMLRIYFSLLHFGTVETSLTTSTWLCSNGRLTSLINCITMSRQHPQWKECQLGAKVAAVGKNNSREKDFH